MPPLSAFDWACADIVSADLVQAANTALRQHEYSAVVAELVRRVRGDRVYDGHPLRPSYEIRGGYVRVWKRDTPMSAAPDEIRTLVDVVRRIFPDLRTITSAHQLHPLLMLGTTNPATPARQTPPRPKRHEPGPDEEEQLPLF